MSEIISKAYAAWMDGRSIKAYLEKMSDDELEYFHDLLLESDNLINNPHTEF